jgi:hypothetical protein
MGRSSIAKLERLTFFGDEMKRKMHYQVQQQLVQPRQIVPLRSEPVQGREEQVQKEIKNFLQALDSYPARVARQPCLSFHQHLCSFFTGVGSSRSARRQ